SVNDQRRNGTATCRLFELVSPAAIIGKRFALERFWIIRNWLAHKKQSHFAAQVVILIVVPVVFWRLYSVAHEHDRRVDFRFLRLALVVGHEILEIFQRNLFTFCGDELERRLWQGLYVDHRYALKISSVFPCRLQSVQRKLRPDVFRSNVSAALPGSPP